MRNYIKQRGILRIRRKKIRIEWKYRRWNVRILEEHFKI
jgi:hypothetical protein